jgi:hypothetical protein
MIVRDVPARPNGRRISGTFNFDASSRTLIALVQMVGDALVLTTLSYGSLSLVKYMEHPEDGYLFDFPYFA